MTDETIQAIASARYFIKILRADKVLIPIGSDFEAKCALAEAVIELGGEVDRLTRALHAHRAHPDFEYETTQTARKSVDDPRAERLVAEGWELNEIVACHEYADGVVVKEHWRNWERFEFHEDSYWRRRKS